MKITSVRTRHANRSIWGHLAEREKTLPLVTPLDIYPQFKETRGSWFWDSGMAVVEIEVEDGLVGTGWCEDGCKAIPLIIENHMSRLLIGQDSGEIEGIWDRLFRASLPYGRKGVALQALSAIDLALWDLAGKATNKPIYQLLGGPVQPDIPVYASALHPVGTAKVKAEAKAYVAEGYKAMKMRFPCGPGHGIEGMRANEEHIANVRNAVGDDIEIMADAYMGWDFLYAKKMVKRLEQYRLAWIEEAFLPDDLNSYAKLRQETDIPVSGGEHEYTRFGFEQIIENKAMDIIQPDLRRCGGLSEGRRICSLALAAGVTVIPHAYGPTHIHFALSETVIPMVEYFPLPCWDALPDVEVEPIFHDEPQPVNGRVSAPDKPGLGVTVNEKIFND
ncbi:MAG TPA: L-rhamnonate dehydratase [Verrucomicrobiales bacterium]|nr:L-rhamnonate dehydratase [Verrucomicrobiales bacterium]HAH98226.1 L-rhamnonate dehydratase [Verrucomicrobiales bacterium]